MDAQMKKGVLELCLLQCLSGEPKYGYDVIQTMRAYFPEVTESTFYAVLRRLHKEGAAERPTGRCGSTTASPIRAGSSWSNWRRTGGGWGRLPRRWGLDGEGRRRCRNERN